MTFIIAEAGVNHGGKLEEAFRLVRAANDCGADAVKFQLFDSKRLWGDDRIAHLQFSLDDMMDVMEECAEVGIEFMCTPFDVEAVDFLAPLVKRMKIASGLLDDFKLLYAVRRTGLPIIASTGMATRTDVRQAMSVLAGDVTLLHCTSAYPCPLVDVNLRAMEYLRYYTSQVGYSDHTDGTSVAVAAVALGACVIEKHLTLDRTQEGPDHLSSIEPQDFARMVREIREVEIALGNAKIEVQPSVVELKNKWRNRV